MLPPNTAMNKSNGSFCYTKLLCYVAMLCFASSKQALDFPDNFLRQFRVAVSSAMRLSFLSVAICHVILMCAKKQMMGVYTFSIVAFVTDRQAIGYRPIVQFPRYPMGATGTPPKTEIPVTIDKIALPLPTFINRAYLCIVKQCILKRLVFGVSHWRPSFTAIKNPSNQLVAKSPNRAAVNTNGLKNYIRLYLTTQLHTRFGTCYCSTNQDKMQKAAYTP